MTGQKTYPRRMGREESERALGTLRRYKQGKAALEQRITEDELWWELRHWEVIRSGNVPPEARGPEPSSAWLFNAILNKHADAMDSYPEPLVLPREPGDEESARVLSEILPVVLENNGFEQVWSDSWWEKLKHGTAAYGVFWNSRKENGLGDIDVRGIDLLKIFWEPGITDIQKSRSLFIADLTGIDELEAQYPQYKGQFSDSAIDIRQYTYDSAADTSGKTVVIDWYYKVQLDTGATVLHYAKLAGDILLYSSEDDPMYARRGWYDDGLYPVVLDVLFPEKGTPVGFGYVAVCKDPQLYIDKLSSNILESSMMGTRKRFFASTSTAVNEEEFLDWSRPIVHVEGELDERRLQEIAVQPLSGVYVDVLQMKIEEMKDTAANRDVNAGSVQTGVTAAAAIAALQEAGNKTSRDMIAASYRAHVAVSTMAVSRMRQFYDETRTFRVMGEGGAYRFVGISNAGLREQEAGPGLDGGTLYRRPVFDLKIRAQKKNPFSRMEQNERAKELYQAGFFDPNRAQEALGALEMMSFEGVEKAREWVQKGQTLTRLCEQLSERLQILEGQVQETAEQTSDGKSQSQTSGNGLVRAVRRAETPKPGLLERLVKRRVSH